MTAPSLIVKGVGNVSESSTSVCRRRYEHSQKRKSVIAPTNAILPTAIPAMAPAVRGFDECGKVEAEAVALAAEDSVSDVLFEVDWESDVVCERESDSDSASESDVDWESDVDGGGDIDVDWESDVDSEVDVDVDCESGVVDFGSDVDSERKID